MNTIIQPGSTIGIVGGGQLGKMLCIAAAELGYKTCVYSDQENSCAFDVATTPVFVRDYANERELLNFVNVVDVITLEFENIPLEIIDRLGSMRNGKIKVFPGREALRVSQDRRLEKELARSLGIDTPKFWVIETTVDLEQEITYPVILKTARNGYDGKGQKHIRDKVELAAAWEMFERVPCVAEEVVNFLYEFSIILVRKENGETNSFPLFENTHSKGILAKTNWPLQKMTQKEDEHVSLIAKKIAAKLEVVGLLAVEMFYTQENKILFNEIAPRPHNSGHVTLDCAVTSQFEQHIRAVCNLPLGNMGVKVPGRMENIIGDFDLLPMAWSDRNAKVHLYGKSARAGRKLGHITYIG